MSAAVTRELTPLSKGTETVEQGTVKFLSKKGYGFIVWPGHPDIFFHVSGIKETEDLQAGEPVTFEAGTSEDGRPKARHIRRVQT